MDKIAILIFGVGELQRSIIERAKIKGLFVVGIDPCANAVCKDIVDAFEVVDGQDYDGTLYVARKYNISAVITAATDKPLVMMARIASCLDLKFYSEETAIISTDKYLMKEAFQKAEIPCAKGRLISTIKETEDLYYPLIIKPRDNSGSRGVILCKNELELKEAIKEVYQYTFKSSVLVEEFIDGQEYSIESLHFGDGTIQIIQFTEKRTSPFPYNVELGHVQPAKLSDEQKKKIHSIISRIGESLHFINCASHTELKINDRGIYVIETSPRLGGDYITSKLVPLSTNINMEDLLLNISLGKPVSVEKSRVQQYSGIYFFSLREGQIVSISPLINEVLNWKDIHHLRFNLKEKNIIKPIRSSLDRYGEFIVQTESRDKTLFLLNEYARQISDLIKIEPVNF